MRTTILTTPRLELTTWTRDDVDDLLAVHSDPATMRFVRHGRPETRSETRALIEEYLAEQDGRGWTKWRLAGQQGQLVGRAGFGEHQTGRELGYLIRRDQWGQGLATEIAAALVGWHRAHVPAEPLWAYVAVENAASCRVLEKVGLVPDRRADHSGLPCWLYRLPSWGSAAPQPAAPQPADRPPADRPPPGYGGAGPTPGLRPTA